MFNERKIKEIIEKNSIPYKTVDNKVTKKIFSVRIKDYDGKNIDITYSYSLCTCASHLYVSVEDLKGIELQSFISSL